VSMWVNSGYSNDSAYSGCSNYSVIGEAIV
jgi:hypothetical protein